MTVPPTAAVLVSVLLPVLVGGLVGGLSGPVLGRLPEPRAGHQGASSDDVAAKLPYADLATPRFRSGCGVLAATATAVVVLATPPHAWPPWLVLATVGVVAAGIDARTTWLPARLTRAGGALVVLSAPVGLLRGGTTADLARVLAAGAAAGVFFWAFWWISRGRLAYGDVRLAPLLGAAGGSISWSMVLAVLLAGSVLGALHGVLRSVRRRSGAFPYAPSLVVGAFVAPVLALLT